MYKNFHLKIFGSVVSILGVVFVFNFIIDPYGLFRSFEIIGINQQKEGVRDKIRHVKSIEVTTKNPKTLIMGSSRVHDGINPESTMIPTKYQPVYNYGIPMIRIKEVKFFLLHALQDNDVKALVLGLDFFMFNAKEKLNIAFDPSTLNKKFIVNDLYLKSCLSSTALVDSIQTIKSSMSQINRKEFLGNGYRPGEHVFYSLKNYEKLHNYTNWIFLSSSQKETLYYQKFALDKEVFLDFEDILLIAQQKGIELFLYINPAHANLDGEGILASGNLLLFEEWKRKITNIANNFNITLWDFSGYNSITTEQVKTPMKYYWDSSHFKEEIGDLILKRVFGNMEDDGKIIIPLDFGIKLVPENIENHLKQTRLDRSRYKNEHYMEVNQLHEMYFKALNGIQQDYKDIEGIF